MITKLYDSEGMFNFEKDDVSFEVLLYISARLVVLNHKDFTQNFDLPASCTTAVEAAKLFASDNNTIRMATSYKEMYFEKNHLMGFIKNPQLLREVNAATTAESAGYILVKNDLSHLKKEIKEIPHPYLVRSCAYIQLFMKEFLDWSKHAT